jgi:hypothetical protein
MKNFFVLLTLCLFFCYVFSFSFAKENGAEEDNFEKNDGPTIGGKHKKN